MILRNIIFGMPLLCGCIFELVDGLDNRNDYKDQTEWSHKCSAHAKRKHSPKNSKHSGSNAHKSTEHGRRAASLYAFHRFSPGFVIGRAFSTFLTSREMASMLFNFPCSMQGITWTFELPAAYNKYFSRARR